MHLWCSSLAGQQLRQNLGLGGCSCGAGGGGGGMACTLHRGPCSAYPCSLGYLMMHEMLQGVLASRIMLHCCCRVGCGRGRVAPLEPAERRVNHCPHQLTPRGPTAQKRSIPLNEVSGQVWCSGQACVGLGKAGSGGWRQAAPGWQAPGGRAACSPAAPTAAATISATCAQSVVKPARAPGACAAIAQVGPRGPAACGLPAASIMCFRPYESFHETRSARR